MELAFHWGVSKAGGRREADTEELGFSPRKRKYLASGGAAAGRLASGDLQEAGNGRCFSTCSSDPWLKGSASKP